MLTACGPGEHQVQKQFTYISPEESGIDFTNTIENTDSLNILNYVYAYNGSGVGVGDINNDGLDDIFFAANQESCRLYLNEGELKFKDITTSAGVTTDRWCTGVSMVDINADGHLDVYVSVAGAPSPAARANLLFLNNGDETFREAALEYGIADTSYTTHAAFFDYDRDGDLDLYLLNHANDRSALNTPIAKMIDGQAQSTDKLYRNDGEGNGFTDVSDEAGILIEGYGLGVGVSDMNQDGWPDLYISNDFISNDLLYLNNQDGTFTNVIANAVKEQTYNGMGNDVSDFNNDGLPDVVVTDMLPPDPVEEKTMASFMTYDKYMNIVNRGYEPQFMRNTLQMNQGDMNFIEIGRYAGIYRTDWSWAPLMADFNNDGWKDLYITNGYLKDITNKDFVEYNNNLSMFKNTEDAERETLQRIEELEGRKPSNFIFGNDGNMRFSDQTESWGLGRESFSNGAIYSDLDNDGDLDLVVNNIDHPAFVIRNNINSAKNFISIRLKGTQINPGALGARVEITTTSGKQVLEQTVYRGFMSSVSSVLHFGVGNDSLVQKVSVLWPDGAYQELTNVPVNQQLQIKYNPQAGKEVFSSDNQRPQYTDMTPQLGLEYKHSYRDPINFKVQPLLPFRISAEGPSLTKGDLDSNGLEDLVVGGGINVSTIIFFQQTDGTFSKVEIEDSKGCEVMDVEIFDANGDGLKDMYLACGGVAYSSGDQRYSDRLYLGNGTTQMNFSEGILPLVNTSTSSVAAADMDGDGDIDLFVGGYAEPQNYPAPPRSYVLKNEGERFVDITEEVSPELQYLGMVRDATWADYNNDKQPDLVVVGEWMPVTIFENNTDHFINKTASLGFEKLTGWWQSISAGDFDNDGDTDFLCGNIGLNSSYTASSDEPVKLYSPDLDNDGIYDPLMTYFLAGKETIHASRGILFKRQPFLNRKFLNHQAFAEATISDIIPEIVMDTIAILKSENFNSVMLVNNGKGSFEVKSLPDQAQLFPINTILQKDLNEDGVKDFILGGGLFNAGYDGTSLGPANIVMMYNHINGELESDNIDISLNNNISSAISLTYKKNQELLVLALNSGNLKIIKLNSSPVIPQ